MYIPLRSEGIVRQYRGAIPEPCVLPHASGAAKRELHVKHPFKTNGEIPFPRKYCIPYTTHADCVGIGCPPRHSGSSDEGRRAGANMPVNGTSVERGKDGGGGNGACPISLPTVPQARCSPIVTDASVHSWPILSLGGYYGVWRVQRAVGTSTGTFFLSAASIEELNIDTLPRNHPPPKEHYSTTIY